MDKLINLNLINNWKYIVPVVVLILILSSVNGLLIGIAVAIFFILYLIFGDKFLLFFIAVSFIALTSEISPVLRVSIQIFNFSVITFLFLKYFGLKFTNYPRVPANLKYFLLSLVLLILISSFNSSHTILGLEKLVTLLLFFYLMYTLFALINSDTEVNLFLFALTFCSIISLMILFFEVLKFSLDLIQIYQNIFTQGGYLGKNNVGVLFSIVIIFLTSFLLSKNFKKHKYLYILLLFLLFGLLITNSRASILCLFISVSIMIYISNKKIFLIGLSIVSGFIIILWLTPLMDEILLYLRIDDIGTGREYLINATIEVIKNNFILGAGPAGTRHELYSNLPYLLNTPAEWIISNVYNLGDINQTHNFYLFFFSDLGIAGFLLSIALPFIFFTNCIKVFKAINSSRNMHYYIIIGLIGSGIFVFTRGLVEQMNIISYGHIYYDLPFWLLFSILTYYYNRYVEIR